LEKLALITEQPCKVFIVPIAIDTNYISSDMCNDLWLNTVPREYIGSAYRSVSIDRLPTVLRQGVDVEPTNAVIWADCLDKALEYGEWPKLVMALDYDFLRKTYVEVCANLPEDELAFVRRDYPTIKKSDDGSKLYCSRLGPDDPQRDTTYEYAHAFWVPGNPWDALQAVFIFYRPQDLSQIENVCRLITERAAVP
jgi:hypothetical protein